MHVPAAPDDHRTRWAWNSTRSRRYGTALLLVAAATLARATVDPLLADQAPFAFHIFAIVVTAWLAGFEGGVVATVASVLAGDFFFVPPRYAFWPIHPYAAGGLLVLAVVGVGVSWVTSRWRHAERALAASHETLRLRTERLEEQAARLERAERAARADHELLRTTLENFPSAIAFTDRDGRVIDVNPAVERALGLPRTRIIGRAVTDFVPAEAAERMRRHDLQVMTARRALQFEEAITLPSGTRYHLNTTFPLVDERGNVYGAGHISNDITEMRATQEALSSNERTLTALMDAATESIWLLDRERIITANLTAAQRLGYTVDQVKGTPWRSLMPPEVVPLRAAMVERVFETAQPIAFEDQRSGIRFEHTFYPALDASGTVVAVAAFSRDVTRQRRLDAELQEVSQRLAYHVSNSPLAVIEFGPDMRLTRWTGSAERVFGWKAEEVLGKRMDEFRWVYEDDRNHVSDVSSSLESGHDPKRFSANRNYRKDGSIVFCEWYNSSLLDERGNLRSILSLVLDVTEKTRLEHELRAHTQQLAMANRLKDDFLATLSHELRTPINAILGWAQILSTSEFSEERLRRGLETITRNARLQARMVEDLLDVSRIVTGSVRLDVHPVELKGVIDQTLDAIRPGADAKQLTVSVDIEPGLTLQADPVRLQQVLWNLLSNAVKFTPSEGRVSLTARRVDGQIEIVVSDTGVGVPPEFVPHVFERFRQADSSPTREHGGLGLGLGLAIVRHIVELHGGTVAASSPGPGRGSMFTVRLPLGVEGRERFAQPSIQPADGESIQRAHPLDGVKTVVVDDEPDSREMLATMLASAGAVVEVAENVDEALRIASQFLPDILISDIAMPGADGYDLIRTIRRSETTLSLTPALALTAYGSASARDAALAAGYDRYLAKPVDAGELITAVEDLTRGENPAI